MRTMFIAYWVVIVFGLAGSIHGRRRH